MNVTKFKSTQFTSLLALCLVLSLALIGCGTDSTNGTSGSNSEGDTESESGEKAIDFPTEPIVVTLPWAPGGSSDLTMRAIADILGPKLDQPVQVVNREGANGTIGLAEAVNARTDGHDVVFGASGAFTAQPHMRDIQYEADDFKGIVGLTYEPILLAVNADSDWETLDDLIAEKDTGRVIKFGHSGAGGFPHVTQAAFFGQAGIEAESVPFEGAGPAVAALLGGHIDTVAAHPAELIPHAESGEFRILGIFSSERFDDLPDVPTFQEKGFDLNMSVWKFLLVPKGTPDEIVAELRSIFTDAINDPQYKEFLENNSLSPMDIDPDEIIPRLNEERESTGAVLSELDIDVDTE